MSFNLRPSEIRYSQESISHKFSNGTPLTSTFARLISGKEKVSDLPAIKCVSRNGIWYSGPRGNRRLFLYKKLEEAGVITTISVLRYSGDSMDFSITGNGQNVQCEDPSMKTKIDEIISQWKRGVDVVDRCGTSPASSASSSSYGGYQSRNYHTGWNSTRPVASSSGMNAVGRWGTSTASSASSNYGGYRGSVGDKHKSSSNKRWDSTRPVASSGPSRFRQSESDPYDDDSNGCRYADDYNFW